MKLYTRSGDDGTTGLFGGGRVRKDASRVEAYGTVDELNAAVGFVAAGCDDARSLHQRLLEVFADLQSRLFDVGADLATPLDSRHADKIVRIGDEEVAKAEAWIDEFDAANDAMTTFVLPGGSELAGRLHVARTVCRRAERRVIALASAEEVNEAVIRYLNRLSDLLFAMARRVNKDAGVPDVPWHPAPLR